MLSVVFSLAWLAIITAVFTVLGIPLWFILPASGVWLALLSFRDQSVTLETDYTRGEAIGIVVFTLGVLLALIVPHLVSHRVSLSAHGSFHSSITYSILKGNIPPMNPGLAHERLIAHYWVYHILLAGLTKTLNIVPVFASLFLSWISIALTFPLLFRLAKKRFGLSTRVAALGMTAPIWSMSTIVPAFHYLLGIDLRATILVPHRVGVFIDKFLTISGFPLGVFLFVSMLVLLFEIFFEEQSSELSWVGFIVAATLLFHVHTTTAFFAFSSLGITTIFAIWNRTRSRRITDLDWTPLLLWVPVGILCLPFLYLLLTAGQVHSVQLTASQKQAFGPISLSGPYVQYLANARNFAIPLLVAIPLSAFGYLRLVSRRPDETRVLGALSVSVLLFGIFFTLRDNNQYKAAYLLVLPLAPLAAVGLDTIYQRSQSTRPILTVLFLAVLLFNPLSHVWAASVTSPWASDHNYEFHGTDVELSNSAPLDPAVFKWVSQNTAPDSSLIVSNGVYDRLDYQKSSINTYMIVGAMTRRNLYYAWHELPSHLLPPDSASRAREVDRIRSCNDDVLRNAGDDHPLYFLVTTDGKSQDCNLYRFLDRSDDWKLRTTGDDIGVFEYVPPSDS